LAGRGASAADFPAKLVGTAIEHLYAWLMDFRVGPLVEAIEALPCVGDPDGVAALLAAADLLLARVSDAVDELERSGAAVAEGAVNTRAWLRSRAGRSDRDAAMFLRRATRLRALPLVGAAWRTGRLSTAHVDAVVAHVSERTEALFAEQQEMMVGVLVHLTARQAGLAMSRWAAYASALVGGEGAPPGAERALYLSPGFDGGGELSGRLDSAGFEIVDAAIAAAVTDESPDEPSRTMAQRRADALVGVARFFLDHAETASVGRRRRPHVAITMTLADLEARAGGRTVDARPARATTVEALLCDAGVHRFVRDGASVVVDVGRTTRTVGQRLFETVALRDGGCRFPGCDRPVSWCEAHHVVPWHQGGPTDRDNLVLLCWRHHHDFAHHPQWRLRLLANGTVEVSTPSGRVLTSRPPPTTQSTSSYQDVLNLFKAVS
jgi:hypothetical protein